ncbi:DUF1206 domain-containing protein [Alteromonas oceanisediminis]|uniref:DUF1206 domain-containing protein n=1 Tax=Alteromonas oceanisediminis TaxID=2836180 RepID=UPI001BDAE336|nr:DUF1206 domain-containing protein [Alteromonas oceanisediminis]MBT0585415.1 DUF1206 domain-containing protein [Alteromonas oceanisediminis]
MSNQQNAWIKVIGRTGYAAKAVVYFVLGILIIYAALSLGSTENITKKSVFQEVLNSPFGYASLFTLTGGLGCYVVWRLVQGTLNPSGLDMSKTTDVVHRGFYFVSAIAYSFVTYVALETLLNLKSEEGSGQSFNIDEILQETWITVGMCLVSTLIILYATIQFKHAFKRDFTDKFVDSMPHSRVKIVKLMGSMGFSARGVVYTLIGVLSINASIYAGADKPSGLSEALSTLMQQPYGKWLVAVVGVGMLGFSIFCGLEGRYRKTY